MSCRRAFEVDLAGFLMDPRAEEFASFRDHYPRCSECSAEVGVWTQLEQQLSTPAEAHPDPVALERYEQGAGLSRVERTRLERHLSACASCRDELQSLRGFRPHQLTATDSARPQRSGLGALVSLRRLAWSPGFAYAVLALVRGPAIYVTLDSTPLVQDRAASDVLDEADALRRPAAAGRVQAFAVPPYPDIPSGAGRQSGVSRFRAAILSCKLDRAKPL